MTLYEFVLLVGITIISGCSFNLASRRRISFALLISGWLLDLSRSVKSLSVTSSRKTSTWGLAVGAELAVLVLFNPVPNTCTS